MKTFILDVNTPVMIDALKSLGYVYKVKPGKQFDEIKRDGFSEVFLKKDDFRTMTNIINYFKSKEITAVISFNENTRKFWYDFAKKLEVRTNLKAAYVFNQNKINARKKINSVATNQVKWYTVDQFLQLSSEDQHFPVILKPRIGKGSMNVHKCDNLKLLKSFLNDKDYSNFFVEEFIDGKEFSIEGIHVNGRHIIYGVTSKMKYEGTVVEAGHISNVVHLTDPQKNELMKIYDALEYSNIVSHTEIMIKSDGSLFYIESHPRLGGDLIPTLTLPEFSEDFYQLIMKVAIGKAPEFTLKAQKNTRFSLFPEPKKLPAKFIYSKNNINFLKKRYGCYLVLPNFSSGEVVTNIPSNSYDRPIALACEVSSVNDVSMTINNILAYCDKHLFSSDI